MSDIKIVYGAASNVITLDLPDNMVPVTSGKVTALDSAGGETDVTADSVTVATASTISVAAVAGDDQLTATAGTYEPGQRWHLADGNDGPPEIVTVAYFNSSTKVVYLRDELKHSHAASTALAPAFVTYDLDASDTAVWTNLLEGKLKFDTWSTGAGAVWRSFVVSKLHFGIGGLESYFALNYPRFWEAIRDNRGLLDELAEVVIADLSLDLGIYGKLFRAVVTQSDVKRVITDHIALEIAYLSGWQTDAEMLAKKCGERMSRLRESRLWFDADENDIKEESENQIQDKPPISRCW